jgi:ADP-heptose:LPS heptosyltransferase
VLHAAGGTNPGMVLRRKRWLRQRLPQAEVVGLIGPWGLPVLEKNRQVDRLILWDFPWFDRRPARNGPARYWSLLRLATLLQAEQFDLALQCRADFWWGALAVRLAGIPVQVGFAAPAVRPFLSHPLPIQHGGHAVAENLALVSAAVAALAPEPAADNEPFSTQAGRAGAAGTPLYRTDPLEFSLSDAERQRAATLLMEGVGRRVAIVVGAGATVKRWPVDRLAAVARTLRAELGVGIVVTGAADERDAVAAVVQAAGPGAVGLAGQTTVGELAAVLERCDLALGADSGPLHLAVAMGTPTLHLFGPADPRRFGPFGDPARHRVIQSPRACVPCNQLTFSPDEGKRHPCMAEIPTDQVYREALALLQRSARRA